MSRFMNDVEGISAFFASGSIAILGDVFGSVPGAGRYRTALVLDGNVGIGGSPALLLRSGG